MSSVSIKVGNIPAIVRKFKEMGQDLSDNRVADAATALVLDANRKRFLAETDPDDQPWVPSKAGAARRAKGGTGTLFDTGTLFHSIQAFRASGGVAEIGTNVPYARKHQEGIGVEKRVFLGISENDTERVLDLVERMVERSAENG